MDEFDEKMKTDVPKISPGSPFFNSTQNSSHQTQNFQE
jgi:hypothetical protein